LLVFLLFGANKFPSMMKNLAEGLHVFKKELGDKKSAEGDEKPAAKKRAPAKKKAAAATKKRPAKKK
jgi:Sec-independent protein translocase protein TatA